VSRFGFWKITSVTRRSLPVGTTYFADAVWRGKLEGRYGPVFSAEWSRPAAVPRRGIAEADLSVQLSGWMVLEAAARLPR